MAWIYLVIAGMFEIGWPLGLKLATSAERGKSTALTLAIVCMCLSGLFLLKAQRTIPMGTAYAVWTGIGAVGTFFVGLLLFKEPATAVRFLCVGLIAGGIIGLKLSAGATAH
jgi:quaternary ammonium compound-resistance protein SugE